MFLFCLFLRLRVSICLSPFSRHFLKTYCALSNYSLLSLLFLPPFPCLCSLSHLSYLSLLLGLSLSLSFSVYVFQVSLSLSVLVTLFPSLPSDAHPRYLSLQAWSLPGSLTLYYASFSVSVSLTVTAILSPGSSSLWLSVLATQSLSPSFCLAYPLSIPLLYHCISKCLCTPLSPISSPLLSPPPPPPLLSLSLGAQPTYRNRSWPAVSQICSFTVFPPTLTTRDPNSTPIVWLESCLTGSSGRAKRGSAGAQRIPCPPRPPQPVPIAGETEAQGGTSKEHTP